MERLVAHRERPAPSLRKACPAAPKWLDWVFRKMVAKRPEDRYQSMAEVISALEQHAAPTRKRWRRIAGTLVVALVVAGFAFLLPDIVPQGRPGNEPKPKVGSTGAETNLARGKRLCFEENKWAEGLPLLAECSDDRLRRLATAELKEIASPQEKLKLGDSWWDFAGGEVGVVWKGAQQRAAHWYRQAVPASGPQRAMIEQRLKDLEGQPADLEVLNRRVQVFPGKAHGFARTANLVLEVSDNGTTGPGARYAGLELKGIRLLDAVVTASPNLERLARNSLAGLMVDYHVGSGYTKRVAVGFGVVERNRVNVNPQWGKHDVPDEYVDLGRHDRYELDLQQWAPPEWDGQSWVTLSLQQAGLDTAITAQLIPVAKRQQQEHPLDLPVKPTWRTTSEYPLIAGRWCESEGEGMFVDVRQYGDEFVATTTYQHEGEAVSWRMEGRIDRDGHITAKLVHVQPHPPDKWLPQTRTAILEPDGKAVHGYCNWGSGGCQFDWQLREPREAEEKELSP